jgi:hypothetical protein
MIVCAGVGAALAVLLHALWQGARGPAAWIAVAGGTTLWGVVETAELRLSLGRAMLLFEAGLVCFALAGMLFVLLGEVVLLVAWGVGVYAFLKALEAAFRRRAVEARRERAGASGVR